MSDMPLEDCFRALDLPVGATLADAEIAYRSLVRVWHPDRFPNSPDLKSRAEEKLKQLNAAIEGVRRAFAEGRTSARQAEPSTGDGSIMRETVTYKGSDPRLQELNLAERLKGGRSGVVELSDAGIVLVTVRNGRPCDAILYDRERIRDVRKALDDRDVHIFSRDSEGILKNLITTDLRFRNAYMASLFVKRAVETLDLQSKTPPVLQHPQRQSQAQPHKPPPTDSSDDAIVQYRRWPKPSAQTTPATPDGVGKAVVIGVLMLAGVLLAVLFLIAGSQRPADH